MPTKCPDKLVGKARMGFIRKCLVAKRKTRGKLLFGAGPQYLTANDRVYQGKQNKHHGTKPGSHKHKRNIIKKSRRANRGR